MSPLLPPYAPSPQPPTLIAVFKAEFHYLLPFTPPFVVIMSSGERASARVPPPLGYQHLTDGHLFDEPTAPPQPLKELPYPYGLLDGAEGDGGVCIEKEWEGLLVPTKLQLLRNHKGGRVVVKVHDGVLQENVARIKSIHCNHPGWCIVGVRACVVADSSVPVRPSGGAKPVKVLIIQDYMDLHSFKDIVPPHPLPQRPPPIPEPACAWAAKCVRSPTPNFHAFAR